eukprot:2955029-Pleurochrysis_carterae.AAC.2
MSAGQLHDLKIASRLQPYSSSQRRAPRRGARVLWRAAWLAALQRSAEVSPQCHLLIPLLRLAIGTASRRHDDSRHLKELSHRKADLSSI